MDETVLALLGLAVLCVGYFWLAGNDTNEPTNRNAVSDEMVQSVSIMFPHVPVDVIRADLERTRRVETTVERLLSGAIQYTPVNIQATSSSQLISKNDGTHQDLLDRIRNAPERTSSDLKPVWESTAEARQAHLIRRKEQMLLEARRKFLDEQQKNA